MCVCVNGDHCCSVSSLTHLIILMYMYIRGPARHELMHSVLGSLISLGGAGVGSCMVCRGERLNFSCMTTHNYVVVTPAPVVGNVVRLTN